MQRSGTIITNSHMLLGFADDIDIIGINRRAVEGAFGPLRREAARLELENGVWRRRMNHEVYQANKSADIVKRIKHGRLQWAGHVARMPDEHQAKAIFSRNPDRGRRLRGRPRTRWMCALDEDAREIGVRGDWRIAAQNRGTWRRILDSALDR